MSHWSRLFCCAHSSVQSNGCWSALLPEQTVRCCWESTLARFSGWRHLLCVPPSTPWLFLAFINPSLRPAVGFIVPCTCCPIGIHFLGCELSGQIMSTIVALTCLPFSVLSTQSVWHGWNCQFTPVYVKSKLDHIGGFLKESSNLHMNHKLVLLHRLITVFVAANNQALQAVMSTIRHGRVRPNKPEISH